jgi:hypothetical protein
VSTPFKPSPVNFHAGIWREDDPAARAAIRAAYRRRRRSSVEWSSNRQAARTVAREVAVALTDYEQRRAGRQAARSVACEVAVALADYHYRSGK